MSKEYDPKKLLAQAKAFLSSWQEGRAIQFDFYLLDDVLHAISKPLHRYVFNFRYDTDRLELVVSEDFSSQDAAFAWVARTRLENKPSRFFLDRSNDEFVEARKRQYMTPEFGERTRESALFLSINNQTALLIAAHKHYFESTDEELAAMTVDEIRKDLRTIGLPIQEVLSGIREL